MPYTRKQSIFRLLSLLFQYYKEIFHKIFLASESELHPLLFKTLTDQYFLFKLPLEEHYIYCVCLYIGWKRGSCKYLGLRVFIFTLTFLCPII